MPEHRLRLHQNCLRDYDPAVGRYVESDPIGWAVHFQAIRLLNRTAVVAGAPLPAPAPSFPSQWSLLETLTS
jgi:RHS repeat-associated protein